MSQDTPEQPQALKRATAPIEWTLDLRKFAETGNLTFAIAAIALKGGKPVPETEAKCVPAQALRDSGIRTLRGGGEKTPLLYYLLKVPAKKRTKLRFFMLISPTSTDSYGARFIYHKVHHDATHVADPKFGTQFTYAHQISLGSESPVFTDLEELGHWTRVQLREVGEHETLYWVPAGKSEEWAKAVDELAALRAALGEHMQDQRVNAVYKEVARLVVLTARRLRALRAGESTGEMDAELKEVKEQDLFKKLHWLEGLAAERAKRAA